MRIRFKPWARQELEESKFYVLNPENEKGKWKENYLHKNAPLHLELGCGKGRFISNMAVKHPDINYIAIDLVDAMLGLTKRAIEEVYKKQNREIDNVLITRFDIERILLILDQQDAIDRIYINFCNPWPKGKHRKKRLTHTRQLEKYKQFLRENGEIYFKTDDDDLFESSIKYFKESGFEIVMKTYDLHYEEEINTNIENVRTEHEDMFSSQGIKIKALVARLI